MTHILVDAGPGTGKSLTLEHSYKYLLSGSYSFSPTQEQVNICHYVRESIPRGVSPANCCFVMYNEKTKEYMKSRLSSQTKVFTFHGLGYSILTKRFGHLKKDTARGQRILSEILGKPLNHFPYNERLSYFSMLKYLEACKEELLLPNQDNFIKIQEKYGFPPPPENVDLANQVLTAMRHNTGTFEFIDQVWLAVQQLNKPIYKVMFVDEAQDVSSLRLELALSAAENVIFSGDPFQAINAFAGADSEAWDKLGKICAYTLPLKTSFRLPPNHIEYANTVRPARIVPYKTDPGPIHTLQLEELPVVLNRYLSSETTHIPLNNRSQPKLNGLLGQPTPSIPQHPSQPAPSPNSHLCPVPQGVFPTDPTSHLLIARTNAQLFRVGIHLIKAKIPSTILTRKDDNLNIAKVLTDYFLKTSQGLSEKNYRNFLDSEIRRSIELPYKQRVFLEEKANCIKYLLNEVEHLSQIPTLIDSLTAERERAVRLSTIHKAKGMEAPFVYILFPPIRHPSAQSAIEIEQEKNLEFVSETRSLFFKGYVKE